MTGRCRGWKLHVNLARASAGYIAGPSAIDAASCREKDAVMASREMLLFLRKKGIAKADGWDFDDVDLKAQAHIEILLMENRWGDEVERQAVDRERLLPCCRQQQQPDNRSIHPV